MAAEIPTYEPSSFVAGDTVKWTRSLSDYSAADGWTLKYAIRGAKAVDVIAETDTDGAGFAVTLSAAESAKLTAGQYQIVGYVVSDDDDPEQYTVYGPAAITVEANVANAQAGDLANGDEALLAATDAAILALTTGGVSAYSIGSRAVTKLDLPDLRTQRGILKARLRKQQSEGWITHEVCFD